LKEAKQELEKKMKSEEPNLRYQLLRIFLRQFFHHHPYRFFHLGDRERCRLFQVQDVSEYYSNLYIPENITIVIVGDFKRARVIRFLQRSIGSFSRIARKSYTWNQESDLDRPVEVIKKHTLHEQIALVSVGWKAPSIRDKETYGMDVLVAAIGMGESSRLNEHMKDQRGSVYSVWAEYSTPREPGFCMVTAVCDPSVVDDVKRRILKEVDILRADSITPEELKKGIRYIKTQEAYSHQETMGTAYYLGYCSTVQDFKFYQTYLQNIEHVTIQDIRDVVIKYLKSGNYTSVILMPSKDTKGEAR
jgi:zinc protease